MGRRGRKRTRKVEDDGANGFGEWVLLYLKNKYFIQTYFSIILLGGLYGCKEIQTDRSVSFFRSKKDFKHIRRSSYTCKWINQTAYRRA